MVNCPITVMSGYACDIRFLLRASSLELFENIYYNTISGDIETYSDISAYNLLEFNTESRHEASFVSITPDSSATLIDVSGYILLEFD